MTDTKTDIRLEAVREIEQILKALNHVNELFQEIAKENGEELKKNELTSVAWGYTKRMLDNPKVAALLGVPETKKLDVNYHGQIVVKLP